MARFVEEYKEGKTGNTVGPLNWMAPESLLHQTYSIKSDMWSFGCLRKSICNSSVVRSFLSTDA